MIVTVVIILIVAAAGTNFLLNSHHDASDKAPQADSTQPAAPDATPHSKTTATPHSEKASAIGTQPQKINSIGPNNQGNRTGAATLAG